MNSRFFTPFEFFQRFIDAVRQTLFGTLAQTKFESFVQKFFIVIKTGDVDVQKSIVIRFKFFSDQYGPMIIRETPKIGIFWLTIRYKLYNGATQQNFFTF
uniref:Uncharacterized protein n=1 Tax=Romanomermis culicivorax TaxID=13658 RepID=A0A915KNW1_ROMCU